MLLAAPRCPHAACVRRHHPRSSASTSCSALSTSSRAGSPRGSSSSGGRSSSPSSSNSSSSSWCCRRPVRCRALGDDDDDSPSPPPEEAVVIGSLTGLGLAGTIATLGASMLGTDVWSHFRWEQHDAVLLALALQSPLLFLDAALFAGLRGALPDSLLERQAVPSQQPQPERHLSISALQLCSAWSVASWQCLLAVLPAVLQSPQQAELPQLPVPAAAGLVVAREGVRELLQRGLAVTALARWLTDRLYEADLGGLDGTVSMPGGVAALTLPELGLCLATCCSTAFFSPGAALASEQALESVSGALLLRTEPGSQVAKAAAAVRDAVGRQRRGAGGTVEAADVQQLLSKQLLSKPQQQPAGDAGEEEGEEEALDPLVLEYRLVRATEACWQSAPAQLAARLTLAMELGRLVLAQVAYLVTDQNLAATWTAALAAGGCRLLYARRHAAAADVVLLPVRPR